MSQITPILAGHPPVLPKSLFAVLFLATISLSGCNQPEENESAGRGGGGSIKAVNHTKWAINHFSVNGQSGIDIIGPWQGGGGGGCYGAPAKWTPGMTVKVDWQTGIGYSMDFPGYQNREKYYVWRKKIKESHREHSQIVPVPDYSGQDTCGITVHFLPCDQVKVTTSCYSYGSPEYPIKDSLKVGDLTKMEEPEICPK